MTQTGDNEVVFEAPAKFFHRLDTVSLTKKTTSNKVRMPQCSLQLKPAYDMSTCRVTWTPDSRLFELALDLDVSSLWDRSAFDYKANTMTSITAFDGNGIISTISQDEFLFISEVVNQVAAIEARCPLVLPTGGTCQQTWNTPFSFSSSQSLGGGSSPSSPGDQSFSWSNGSAPGTNDGFTITPNDGYRRLPSGPMGWTWNETFSGTLRITFIEGALSVSLVDCYFKMEDIRSYGWMFKTPQSGGPGTVTWTSDVLVYNPWGLNVYVTSGGGIEQGTTTLTPPSLDPIATPECAISAFWSGTVPDPSFKTDPADVDTTATRTSDTGVFNYFWIDSDTGAIGSSAGFAASTVGPHTDSAPITSPASITITRQRAGSA